MAEIVPVYVQTAHTDRNNFIGSSGHSAGSLESLFETNSLFTFGIKWLGDDGQVANPASAAFMMSVGIQPTTFISGMGLTFEPDPTLCPLFVQWEMGTLAGTIKETYKSFDSVIATRDNIDPGYGALGAGRPGPRYTFLLSGSEYRVYVNYVPAGGVKPIAVVAGPSDGFPFPLSLAMACYSGAATYAVTDIVAAAGISPTTVYSVRDQTEDFGAARSEFHARIYQNGATGMPDGQPVDINL